MSDEALAAHSVVQRVTVSAPPSLLLRGPGWHGLSVVLPLWEGLGADRLQSHASQWVGSQTTLTRLTQS